MAEKGADESLGMAILRGSSRIRARFDFSSFDDCVSGGSAVNSPISLSSGDAARTRFDYEPWSADESETEAAVFNDPLPYYAKYAQDQDSRQVNCPPIGRRRIVGHRLSMGDDIFIPTKPVASGSFGIDMNGSGRIDFLDDNTPHFNADTSVHAMPPMRYRANSWTPPGNKSFDSHYSAPKDKYCALCAKNGELKHYVMSHDLKDKATGRVTCPALRKYVCPSCGATGDYAHTESYCPKRHIGRSVTMALKNTPRNSTGLRPNKVRPPRLFFDRY